MVRFWFQNCPRCGPEGELFIARILGENSLVFRCDECLWFCRNPQDLEDYFKGEEGYSLAFEWPALSEIEACGWAPYCLHAEEGEPPP